jgi:tetratricopeptide (TPR) repeat protein
MRACARPLKKDRGQALLNKGRFDEAVAWAELRIKENPNDYDAMNKAGLAYFYKARKDASHLEHAYAYFKRSAEIDPLNALSHYNLGLVFLAMNRPREAVPEMRKTTLLAPEFAPGFMGLSLAHFRTGDPLRGAAALRRAVQLNPQYKNDFSKSQGAMQRHMRKARFLVVRQLYGRLSGFLLWAGPPQAVAVAHANRVAAIFALFMGCFAALLLFDRGARA